MKIVLIRHTSLAIASGICYGQSDIDVSTTFIDEASIVQASLSDYTFDHIYTSPLQRCVKLADYCGFPDAIRDNQLLELNFGDWEGQNWNDIQDDNLNTWYNDWINTACTGGESFMMQYQRYLNFITKLQSYPDHQSATIAVFTHAGILHCARVHKGLDRFDNTFEQKLQYGEILTIEI